MSMEILESGYLEKKDGNKILFSTKILLFKDEELYYFISLELGILGHGKTKDEALRCLAVLFEYKLLFRAESPYPIEIVPAEEKYFKAFQDLTKNYDENNVIEVDFNSLAKRIKDKLDPERVLNYGMFHPIAVA